MKKVVSAIIALGLLLNVCITTMAAADLDRWDSQEETSADFYRQEEPLAAAAIVNADSFVDRQATPENFDVPAKAAVLMDEATGQVLYAKNAEERLHIASITKVMTLLLVFEALEDGRIKYSDTVPISPHAFSMGGSQIWLEPGEIFTVDELLKAVCVSSANDAAVALSELVGGSETVFCDEMNRKAKELGMTNSNFVNACGLDSPNQYSCALDVAIMSRALMEHKKVFEYTTIWMEYLRNGATQLVNTNKLLHSYTGTTGLKTGTTGGAGVCITATAKRQNMSFIAVVLGSSTSEERFDGARKLLDFGFSNFESRPFPKQQEYPKTVKVRFGTEKQGELEYTLPENLLFLKGSAKELKSEVTLPEKVTAPISRGTAIGTVGLYSDGVKIKEYKILLTQDIEKINFKKALAILTKIGSNM